jgi:predicted DCC family thiol-disulfide oxidoreductase YuxK
MADLTVIFDGDCGLCQALRCRAETLDSGGRLSFVAYQTATWTLAPA